MQNEDQIRQWLRLLGEAETFPGDGWINARCPLAQWRHQRGVDRTPSFGVRIEPGDSFCWCFGCSWRGTQGELLVYLGSMLKGTAHSLELRRAWEMVAAAEDGAEPLELDWGEDPAEERDFPFAESWLDSYARAYDGDAVHPYLEGRGVPAAVARDLDLRFMAGERRIAFPVRNWDGVLVGLHGRAVADDVQPKYRMIKYRGMKNPLAWLGESWVDPSRPVVVAESVFDLARVYQVYRNVISPLTASVSADKVDRIRRLDHVVLFFDPDKAGEQARWRIAQALQGDSVVEHLRWEEDERDPGDLSVAEVGELLSGVVDLDEVLV